MTSPSKKPRFSIHLAIQNGETEFIEKLLYYNHLPGDINALDNSGLSPLHVAVLYKKVKIVKVLLKNGADVNMESNDKMVLPKIKKRFRELESIREFEFRSLDDEMFDSDLYTKLTPLHLATVTGSLKLVRLLIENGAQVNVENNQGLRPIHSAIHFGSFDIVSTLFENEAILGNSQPLKKFLGAEDLMDCATDHGSIEIVELLFEKGIKVKGTRAIQIAISNENIDIVKVLVKNGAIIDSEEYEEFPPLHRLYLRAEYEMMQFLIDHGANVDVLGGEEYEETLLHIAAAAPFRSLDLAKFMIKNGANVNSKMQEQI